MAKLCHAPKALLRKYSMNLKFLMMLASVCVIVLRCQTGKFSYDIEKGRIWNQKELIRL